MIRKEQPFIANFSDQFQSLKATLTKSYNVKGKIKGSYPSKEVGTYVTDIDIQFSAEKVEDAPRIMQKIIECSYLPECQFVFVSLKLGLPEIYTPPWSFQEDSNCQYKCSEVLDWVFRLRELEIIDLDEFKWIKESIFGKYVTVAKLFNVAEHLEKKGEISWEYEDICRGYKFVRVPGTAEPVRFSLIELIENEYPVMNMAFAFRRFYVSIDMAVVAESQKSLSTNGVVPMKKFYRGNYYKIIRGLYWRIPTPLKEQYESSMKPLNWYVSALAVVSMLKRMELEKRITEEEIRFQLHDNMDGFMDYNYQFNRPKLSHLEKLISKYIDEILLTDRNLPIYVRASKSDVEERWIKGLISMIPISHQELLEREKITTCPFGMEREVRLFQQVQKISESIDVPIHRTLHCFNATTESLSLTFETLLKNIPIDDGASDKCELVDNYISSLFKSCCSNA